MLMLPCSVMYLGNVYSVMYILNSATRKWCKIHHPRYPLPRHCILTILTRKSNLKVTISFSFFISNLVTFPINDEFSKNFENKIRWILFACLFCFLYCSWIRPNHAEFQSWRNPCMRYFPNSEKSWRSWLQRI